MTGVQLKKVRLNSSLTQIEAASKLGVTQAYLSMIEQGKRSVSPHLAAKAVKILDAPPTELPLGPYEPAYRDEAYFKYALGTIGYPGFSYLETDTKLNPAQVLMEAIDSEDLDPRVVEGLPWIPRRFPFMDWTWLISNAKARARQNRLAFIVTISAQIAAINGEKDIEAALLSQIKLLEQSRLARQDSLCESSMTKAEREWLKTHRSTAAKHWNLLSDLVVEQLDHAFH